MLPAMTDLVPFLMFDATAAAAMTLYVELFDDGEVLVDDRFPPGEGPENGVRHGEIRVAGQRLRCFDSPAPHDFGFTPAISMFVTCDDAAQQERLVAALSEDGATFMPYDDYGFGPFAWVQDRFGVSWQLSRA